MLQSGKHAPGPHFDLEQIKAELGSEKFRVYRTRALDPIRRLRQCTVQEARAYAKEVVLSMEAGDYAHTLKMPNGQLQDVYGKVILADGWYVKVEIHMDDGEVGIVSCHPAEHDLKTRSGTVPRSRRRFA
jgi:hypothetical protein